MTYHVECPRCHNVTRPSPRDGVYGVCWVCGYGGAERKHSNAGEWITREMADKGLVTEDPFAQERTDA